MVPSEDGTSPDLFTEWVYINNAWEMFGSAKIDLSGYLTDVKVGGTTVVTDGVAKIPIASRLNLGTIKVDSDVTESGLSMDSTTGFLEVFGAPAFLIKDGKNVHAAITPYQQHTSTFYGLAKASGDTTQSQSSNPVGTYTDEAKASIQTMLGVPSSDNVVSDVQINNSSVVSNGVATIPIGNSETYGIFKTDSTNGIFSDNGTLAINNASESDIKGGTEELKPLTPNREHIAAFYGLAKASGDSTQSASSNAVGTYTDEAKASIQTMLGVPSEDDVVTDVQINGTSIISDGVANIPYATYNKVGVVQVNASRGTAMSGATLSTFPVDSATAKAGVQAYQPITPAHQHESVFYGLAKAAGDSTQVSSENEVGTYTDDAKSSIQTMLGVPSTDDVVNDVQLNGTSIVSNGTANIPMATSSTLGICFANPNRGIGIRTSSETDAGQLYVDRAYNGVIKIAADEYRPIVPFTQHVAVFYGLAKLAGADMSTSSNAIGTYTDEAKTAIKQMLGVKDNYDSFIVDVDGTDPVITGQPSYRYNCGEIYSLTVTPPSSGTIDFRFTSGSTPTVLTLPQTVKMPEWWVEVEANTIYEMCITDGVYCGVMSWAM